jgi:hypothetical protein
MIDLLGHQAIEDGAHFANGMADLDRERTSGGQPVGGQKREDYNRD